MTRGLGGHSPANVTHHLKGVHFPAEKRDLIGRAKENGAPPEVMEVLENIPEGRFESVADVMKGLGQTH